MPALAAAAPYIGLATTAVSVHSQIQAGKAASHRADVMARQKEADAEAAQVEAQQQAAGERKKARFLRSRALAVAGASGAGVSDPTISNILTGIDTEGEMNALNTLWSGDTTSQGLRNEAASIRSEGRSAESAGYMSAFTTALSGGMDFAEAKPTFFQKYGGKRAERIGKGTTFSDFQQSNKRKLSKKDQVNRGWLDDDYSGMLNAGGYA